MEYPEPGKTIWAGWGVGTPDICTVCGYDDRWCCDGRGDVTCECQANEED